MPLPLAATIAARFPLVGRKRPPARPLDARVNRLAGLAETAHREHDFEKASMVFNGAALVASDCGDAELARAWCHRHANLYLSQAPLDGHTTRFALEPVVNLARLRIRAGDGDAAHALLTNLYEAIAKSTFVVVDGIELHPQQLPGDPHEIDQIIGWTRGVLLSDGTRALTRAGRWADALNHVRHHDGIGPRLLDGRQVAVVAHILRGDGPSAAAILSRTQIALPWEGAVRDLLQSWHKATFDGLLPVDNGLFDTVAGIPQSPGLTMFRVRLGLTALDLTADVSPSAPHDLIQALAAEVIKDGDANAASVLLGHPAVGPEHHVALVRLIEASGLGLGYLPESPRVRLSSALDLAETAIRGLPRTR